MKKITFIAYDTLCTIRISQPEGKDAGSVLMQARALALSVQDTLNMYSPDSELSRLCASYTPGVPAPVSPMLYDFIRLNLEFSQRTDGAFDFTVGPLVKLWDFLSENPRIPPEQALEGAMKQVGYRHVRLDSRQQAVVFDREGMTLDPGASGKGYALGLAADFLKDSGVRSAVLDFGGNLFVIGHKPSGTGQADTWRVGIRHPDRDGCLGTVCLAGRGIATSSWYEHSFCKGDTVYHHLLDPYTGRPKEMDISSVSILSSGAVYTDLLSTAFFVMGHEAGCALAHHLRHSRNIDVDYVILKKDGSVLSSEGACFTQSAG